MSDRENCPLRVKGPPEAKHYGPHLLQLPRTQDHRLDGRCSIYASHFQSVRLPREVRIPDGGVAVVVCRKMWQS